jgi:hypothetical protein
MKEPFQSRYFVDETNAPEGGNAWGTGFSISWQRGPLGQGEKRLAPNGAFVETIIDVVRERLENYQHSRFACVENEEAIKHLEAALLVLNSRTLRRSVEGTEGTLSGK